jgi:hypothetical protein
MIERRMRSVSQYGYRFNASPLYTIAPLPHAHRVMKRGSVPVMQFTDNCLFI